MNGNFENLIKPRSRRRHRRLLETMGRKTFITLHVAVMNH